MSVDYIDLGDPLTAEEQEEKEQLLEEVSGYFNVYDFCHAPLFMLSLTSLEL